jgi:hypothetical protein
MTGPRVSPRTERTRNEGGKTATEDDMNEDQEHRRPMSGRLLGIAFALALLAAAAGCSGNVRSGDFKIHGIAEFRLPAFPEAGSFIEVFNEMHYQPSYKSQEGPRILPPPNSVSIAGRDVQYTSLAAHEGLQIPQSASDSYDAEETAELYRINCLVCHGDAMAGDGPVGVMMQEKGLSPVPANLTLELTQDSPPGDLFAFISWGGRQGSAANFRGRQSSSPMPEFRLLLTDAERWALVKYLLDR